MSQVKQRPTAILWFRNDLRIADNAALDSIAANAAILPLYIREIGDIARPVGGAKNWWLHHSLLALAENLAELGAPLVLASGDPYVILGQLAQQTGAAKIVWNRRYLSSQIEHDTELKHRLADDGIEVETFAGFLLHEPTKVKTGTGGFYKVFSPFWRNLESGSEPRKPIPAPRQLHSVSPLPQSEKLADWNLLPTAPDWSTGLAEAWQPGEKPAHDRLAKFAKNAMENYAVGRDHPGVDLTSRLSPHLALGEISPAQIVDVINKAATPENLKNTDAFRRQIGWREFSWHLLVNEPTLASTNHDPRFDEIGWSENPDAMRAWQNGQTGYPIVDAGMRQLWQTGWMHNRVRMITASFLTKHLMIHWKQGEAWFWDTLVDADAAANSVSWQWVAGCGFDAAPYFRVFNPIIQGEKFDPHGSYVRKYVPEIAALPDKYLHKPWQAPAAILEQAGIRPGKDYPHPIVDHAEARDRALSAYANIKDAT